MLNAELLKIDLKSDLLSLMEQCWNGESGMTVEEYADRLSGIIATRVTTHIKNYAQVSTNITGTGGPYTVTGTGTGGIS